MVQLAIIFFKGLKGFNTLLKEFISVSDIAY